MDELIRELAGLTEEEYEESKAMCEFMCEDEEDDQV